MRGYPAGTIAFYGPNDELATKVAVGIVMEEGSEAEYMQRWYSDEGDIRNDLEAMDEAIEFLKSHGARAVVMTDRIIGCPHEEGIDYPDEQICPECPFWARRNRFSGELIQ